MSDDEPMARRPRVEPLGRVIFPATSETGDCLCIHCCCERWSGDLDAESAKVSLVMRPVRFACEICGNKRCPHHSDHRLGCTGSNELGQLGSIYE